MIQVCNSRESITYPSPPHSNSRERLKRELEERDVTIASLRQKLAELQANRPRRSLFSGLKQFARKLSISTGKGRKTEMPCEEYSEELGVVIVGKQGEPPRLSITTVPISQSDGSEKRRAKSVSALTSEFYESASCWDIRAISNGSIGMLVKGEPEFMGYEEAVGCTDLSSIEDRLSDEACLLVFGCPRELVPLLRPDILDERKRRWLLLDRFTLALK